GYRVCVSTHSPQVLELIWALKRLRATNGRTSDILDLFTQESSQRIELRPIAETARSKKLRVFYFERSGGRVHDISDLDPFAERGPEANWGGLTEFSERVNATVAEAANSSAYRR